MTQTPEAQFPLLARADQLVDELRKNVPAALKEFDGKAIHQARVATRRLKAALDLMQSVLSEEHSKPFSRVLRNLRRRLGPLRDLDVMIEHLAELRSGRQAGTVAAVAWVSEQLVAQREAARAEAGEGRSVGKILSQLGTWWGVREEVAEAEVAIDLLLAESLHEQLDAFGTRAAMLANPPKPDADESANNALATAGGDPHELRIAGKLLRYTLEMAALQGHRLPSALMKSFKQMQESLGLWHDYVVLSERAMQVSLEALLPHHNAPLQASVLDLAKLLLRRSSKHLAAFGNLWAERGDELTATIRRQFPLTRPVTGSQTDPDPAGSPDTPAPGATGTGDSSAV